MFGNIGGGEVLFMTIFGLLATLIPIALAIVVVVTLVRIQRGVDRIAAAAERLANHSSRVP